jgi:uncharacterized protein YecE (DUF72 family)
MRLPRWCGGALGHKLLCCCLQFGSFNRRAFASLGAFLDRLDPFLAAWPADVPVAVEVRNQTWMAPELADCLRPHTAVWVLPDQAWMPSPLSVVERLDVVTGPFAYVRMAEPLGTRDGGRRLLSVTPPPVKSPAAGHRLLASPSAGGHNP